MAGGRGGGGQFGDRQGGRGLRRGGGRRRYLLQHLAAALDDAHLAFSLRDFQFRDVRFRDQIDQGFEFSQVHASSKANS